MTRSFRALPALAAVLVGLAAGLFALGVRR
jgi:hypothetical protein